MWAATPSVKDDEDDFDISIHAARVGSDPLQSCFSACHIISIHAARVGSDLEGIQNNPKEIISIHAARVGSDKV